MKTSVARPQVLAILAVAEFMLTLDLSIVNVALPSIQADLGFGPTGLVWVVNGYALMFGGFLLLGGRAADRFGGRTVFLSALGLFSVASLACGLAVSAPMLITGRVLQGLGAGVLAPATLSVLTETYREQEERTRALSVWTGVAIGGGAVGGLVGGLLVGTMTWRSIFFLNVPIGAVLLALAARRLRRRPADAGAERLDVVSAVTLAAGLTALSWALMRPAAWSFVVALILLVAFGIESRLVRAPLIPFGFFASRAVSAGNLLSFLSFVPVMATWYLLTLYLQETRGLSAIETGLIFLPLSLSVIGGSQLSFRLLGQVGGRLLFGVGGVVAAIGMWWLGQLADGTPLAWIVVPASLAMLGGGLMFAPVTTAATAGVPPERGGLASGLLNTTRQVGGALGLAVLGAVASGNGAAGAGRAFAVGAAVFVSTAVIGAVALPARPPSQRRV